MSAESPSYQMRCQQQSQDEKETQEDNSTDMIMEIKWVESLATEQRAFFKAFVQGMADRIQQGRARYGPPHKSKRYFARCLMELNAYGKTGNMEHLINAANYCYLEAEEPSNPLFHYDSRVDSATRGKI